MKPTETPSAMPLEQRPRDGNRQYQLSGASLRLPPTRVGIRHRLRELGRQRRLLRNHLSSQGASRSAPRSAAASLRGHCAAVSTVGMRGAL